MDPLPIITEHWPTMKNRWGLSKIVQNKAGDVQDEYIIGRLTVAQQHDRFHIRGVASTGFVFRAARQSFSGS